MKVHHLTSLLKQLNLSDSESAFLTQAFVHRSYLNEHPGTFTTSNERLEFLGDSVLSVIISEYLYATLPQKNEGYLTAIRSGVVSKFALAKIATELNLGEHLFLAKGEEEGGGRKNPSILADTLEALFGALFLSQNLEVVKKIILDLLKPKLEEIIQTGRFHDFKSLLQEAAQDNGLGAPVYKVLRSIGPDHAKQFEVGVYVNDKLVGTGEGKSKQSAQQNAAEKGLEHFSFLASQVE